MTLQVLEHEKLRIGERLPAQHWQALAAFAQGNAERYFRILHNGIQFSNYVGALQVGDLTIEILPKIDDISEANAQVVLVEMLRECRLLQPESPAMAALREHRGSLLDLYIVQFLDEVQQLLREGLTRSYLAETQNRRTFKGKLLIHKQIEQNLVRPERFFTQTLEYSYEHPFNRLLYTALLALGKLTLPAKAAFFLQQLRQQFPPVEPWCLPLPDFDSLRFNRQTLRYKNTLQVALSILQQTRPELRAGRLQVLAILFDMNFLFEAFIFRQLQQAASKNIAVKRQVPKPFWNRRAIQPDIVLAIDNQNIIIDTKWKKLTKVSPAMDDLRQLFVYNQYFDARHSVLVYPRVPGLQDLEPVPFQPVGENAAAYFCQVRLASLVKDGRLNRQLGAELLEKIL
jgi:5-methylcytosine-specific restriction enzyme subunit McrC